MIYIEALMMAAVLYTGLVAAWSDCRTGLIANKMLLGSLAVLAVLNSIYYCIFCQDCLALFLTNLLGIFLMAFFFYVYHLWAAGDSKLLFVMGFGIPARLYSFWQLGPIPGFAILIIVFSLAYIYVIVDSAIRGIKERNLLYIRLQKPHWRSVICSYLFMVMAMRLINLVLMMVAGAYLEYRGFLLSAIDFFIILSLLQVREHITGRVFYSLIVCGWGIIVLLGILKIVPFTGIHIDFKSWIIVFVVMMLRIIAERYNYQEIPTKDVKERMILSASTVLMFRTSRVQGLPECVTEDLKARISKEEAAAVLRWKDSKQGKSTIMIVRKIPFAIFITVGTIIFLLMEWFASWHIL